MLDIWQSCPVTNSLAPDDQISLRAKGKQPNVFWRVVFDSGYTVKNYPKAFITIIDEQYHASR